MLSRMTNKASKWLQRITFARKITFLFTLVFSFALILISLIVTINLIYFYRSIPKGELSQTLNKVTDFIKQGNTITVEDLNNINPNKFVEIIIINERTNEALSNAPRLMPPKNMMPIVDHAEQIRRTGDFGKENFDFYREEIVVDSNDTRYKVIAFRRVRPEQLYFKVILRLMLAINILGLISAYITAKYISKRFIKPINTIRMAAERITIEDLSRRIEIDGPDDELRDLAVTFNAMIDRLEDSFKKQNQFISDASHELRTPISVIQGYANLINRWGKEDPAILQESIDSIKAETERMTKLVKKLLFLAKGIKNQINKVVISLNQIAEETFKETKIMNLDNIISLDCDEDNINIYADSTLIKQVLWIFLENSIKYSNSNSNITIKVAKEKNKALLSVKDNGFGIAEDDLPFVFERFYRADKSRNKEIDGTGLGLAIAKGIIDQHDGEIKINSHIGIGTEIICVFELLNKKLL